MVLRPEPASLASPARRAELVDQLADGRFGLLIGGLAGARRGELAEEPQQQEWLARDAHLADAGLPEAGQPARPAARRESSVEAARTGAVPHGNAGSLG